ncbi:MAG: aspartate/glutamate racemase family protein, partial [Gammaproteobacteria bacterium]|nr:aspartate/glutamate racemase family protein [Gammaproteobacteria bacterium]
MSYEKSIIGMIVITIPGGNVCMDQIGRTLDHPEIISDIKPFSVYKPTVITKDWKAMAGLILDSLHRLHRAGATFAIIPSNTPHYAFDLYAPKSPIPVLNIIDISVEHCEKTGCRKVAVLGTKQTMEDGLYAKKLEAKGIDAVVPDDETQVLLHQLIMEELVPKGEKANPVLV